MLKQLFILAFFPLLTIFSQEINIVPALKEIESGNLAEAQNHLQKFLKDNPDDPSILFLDAVLTTKGEDAAEKYNYIHSNYPQSKYADASLFREFSYYFSVGAYNKAETLLSKLKSDYSSSPYIKAADRTIPDTDIEENSAAQIKPVTKTENEKSGIAHSNFTIQAGAFLNNSNAQNLKAEFEKQGWYSAVFPKEVGGSILNVVTVGRFENESDANKILQILKNEFNLNGRIIPINQ